MKAVWSQSVVLPAHLAKEKPKKKVVNYVHHINTFFGIATKEDKIWFFGFYSISFLVLFFIIIVVSQIVI